LREADVSALLGVWRLARRVRWLRGRLAVDGGWQKEDDGGNGVKGKDREVKWEFAVKERRNLVAPVVV
jgi:hypothetical protein